jgi:hypothetical protein
MPQSWVGKTVGGRYQVEALLGQGGMSAVYRANDPNLRRPVAIKLIHPHLSSDPNFVGRFKEEAAAVARLRHPNIVQVHDFNSDGDTYYMVMEYLVGETLQTRLKRLNATGRRMPLEEALDMCIQLCEAAGYAHDHELVHRDIKPANVMLTVNGQAILMDFGIVKIIGGDYHTATGATVGTAMYMSAEQIRSERVDDRADIYSLAVTLYEMLSGRPPYLADSAMTLMMMVLNDPLPDVRQTRAGIPETLAAVVHRALAKDPAMRFQTMAEMAAALRQVQAELASAPSAPIATEVDESRAGPAAPHVGPATVTANRPQAQTARVSAAGQPETAPAAASPRPPTGPIPSAREVIEAPAEPAPARPAAAAPKVRTPVRLGPGRVLLIAAGLLVLAGTVAAGLAYVYTSPPRVQLAPIGRPTDPVNAQTAPAVVGLGTWNTGSYIEELAYSPDGSLLGTANNREATRFTQYRYYSGLWQVQAGSLRQYLRGHTQWVYAVAFSPDGQVFGAVSEDGHALLWQVADGRLARDIESTRGGLTGLSFSPNSLLLAASAWDGSISLWQVSNGNLLRTLRAQEYSVRDVEFSPDGRLLAAASDDNSVLLWRVSDGGLERTLQGHTAQLYEVDFSPDGTLLASASEDHTVNLWQVSTGTRLHGLAGHTQPVFDVAFSPDGSLLASASADGTVRLWRVSDGALLSMLPEYAEGVKSVAFSPDGYWLVSGAADGVVQFWGISEALPPEGE